MTRSVPPPQNCSQGYCTDFTINDMTSAENEIILDLCTFLFLALRKSGIQRAAEVLNLQDVSLGYGRRNIRIKKKV